ncbi:fimbrial family protein [Burkholderia thailandensis 34]|nr:fimbrial family protein [Burkholderia thailandensis 34]
MLGLGATQAAFAQTVGAAQGKVTFNGELITSTCTVDAGSKDQIVQLPKVSTNTLTTAGQTAGSRPFDIKVIDCPKEVKVAAHFEMDNMHPESRTLKNLDETDKGAKNVSVQLVEADGTPLDVGSTSKNFVEVSDNGAGKYGATLTYGGQYYALGKTDPGLVNTFTRFTLAYE